MKNSASANEFEGLWGHEPPSDPVVITCAITGNKTTRKMNPNLPITPIEQGIAAEAAIEEGASVIHLHVREDDGAESLRAERYQEAIYQIRRRVPEAIIEVSTRGKGEHSKTDQGVGVSLNAQLWGHEPSLKPEMCSVNVGSMNIGDEQFLNHPKEVKDQLRRIYDAGLVPECDVFDVGHLEAAKSLVKSGAIKTPLHILLVLGIPGGASASTGNLLRMVELLPPGVHWTALGIGRFQLTVMGQAILLGGNIRVGLEDTAYFRKGELAKSNAQLVERSARLCKEFGRTVASIGQSRKILGLSSFSPVSKPKQRTRETVHL